MASRIAAIVLGLAALGFAVSVPAQNRVVNDAIVTTGTSEHGIVSRGAGADIDINDGGSIKTSGSRALGIRSLGANPMITVDGTIETTGGGSVGIDLTGANAEVTINGRVQTTGRNAPGIISRGASATITVDGVITTNDQTASGISSLGAGATITVGGTITTRGDRGADGISSLGSDATITVDGTIETSARLSHGINLASGPRAVVNVNEGAVIRTTGRTGVGIVSTSEMATITVDGTVETSGASGHGVFVRAANNEVTINGMITTTGQSATGIASTHAGTTITVGGTVTTRGGSADGIRSSGADATITMDGMIETTGEQARGIGIGGSNAEVTVNGMIRTTGAEAHGIYVYDSLTDGTGTITINGMIEATGRDSFAIYGKGGQTVRLMPGSRVTGGFFGIGRLEAQEIGSTRGPSSSLVVAGSAGVELAATSGGQPVLMGTTDTGGVIAALDPTASALQRDALAHVTRLIHGAVHDQSTIARSAPGSASHGGRKDWAVAIGGDFDRDDDGMALGWDGEVYGAVGGVENSFGDDTRFGVVGAFVRSDFESDENSIDADTKTAVLGVYGKRTNASGDSKWDLTGSVLGGYSDHEIDRRVLGHNDGPRQASGSYKSWFASAAVGAKWYRPISDKHELRPSVRLDGLIARHRSYSESGAGISNIAYDSWTSASANGRVQMAIATRISPTTELEGRAGAALRLHADDDLTARLVIGGDSVNYDVPGDDSVYGGFIGARLTSMHRDRFLLFLDAEYGRGSDDDEALSARLNLSALF